ncbi:hypothetical protein R3P38DRAFT_3218617 [Favolaschia claudopus]|uniref:Uncharacterized protein n=1 Tax=Favolaschia claudopus TaxID=2862362 RepID=A0AAW0A463_9AGAR
MDNHDFFPGAHEFARYPLLELVDNLTGNYAVAEMIFATPDTGLFLAHAWAEMVSCAQQHRLPGVIAPDFSSEILPLSSVTSEEIVAGVGGMENMALLIKSYVPLICDQIKLEDAEMVPDLIEILARSLMFVVQFGLDDNRLWDNLARVGYAKVVTKSVATVAQCAIKQRVSLDPVLFPFTRHLVHVSRLQPAQALYGGLLTALRLLVSHYDPARKMLLWTSRSSQQRYAINASLLSLARRRQNSTDGLGC